ncbi:hypothetical protein ACFSC4_29200 [Deinococcus malanensis]
MLLGNPQTHLQASCHNVAWLLGETPRTGPYVTHGAYQVAPSPAGC